MFQIATLGVLVMAGGAGRVPTAAVADEPLPTHATDCCLTAEQMEILRHLSLEYIDTGLGKRVKTIRVTGANVQIVNGLGATHGVPGTPPTGSGVTNGVGNLILGYNEPSYPGHGERSGSHNLVVGMGNTYTSFGGVVAGQGSTISAPFASVSGGLGGTASARHSTVVGGRYNTASGEHSAVLGGYSNTAAGENATVSGGLWNQASGRHASVSGGDLGLAYGFASSVSGGFQNTAMAPRASVSGGRQNDATGLYASISGGRFGTASGDYASVTGGRRNVAAGAASVVGGGILREVQGEGDWRAGELFQPN